MAHGEGDGDGEAATATAPAPATALCQECHKHPPKYKCPGCGIRSCGLDCVKAHKVRTSCTGKRNRTAFVPLACYDEKRLISDYQFLEEILRQAESAKRCKLHVGCTTPELGARWTVMRTQARKRNITLLYVPQGMTKRIENTSRYCKRRKCILWRIEWVFHSTDVVLFDTCADENLSPAKMLQNQLAARLSNAATRHKLKQFLADPVESLRFLVVHEPCSSEQMQFVELDSSEPLGYQLSNMTIIEFPVIHVVYPGCTSSFRIVKDLRSDKVLSSDMDPKEKEVDDLNQMEGIPYREEEIEEGEIVD